MLIRKTYGKVKKAGFTLLEVLLVVAALAILAGTVILAINPGEQLADTRDAKRWSDVGTILDAVYQYAIDHNGSLPAGVTTDLTAIGTAGSGCAVTCGAFDGETGEVKDDTQAEFNGGTHTDTQYDALNAWLELTPVGQGNGSGSYISSAKDVGSAAMWDSFAWLPAWPSYKELLNNGALENGYPNGNVSMLSNTVLLHFNEGAGGSSFVDHSGSGRNGTCDTGCPAAGIGGILRNAVDFDGMNDRLNVGTFTPGPNMTVSAWVRPDAVSCSTGPDCEIVQSSGQFVFDLNDGAEYRFCPAWPSCVAVPVSIIDVGEWQLLTAVREGGTCKLYKNGMLLPNGSGPCSTDPLSGTFYVGGHSSGNRIFDGMMDEFAMWDRALSDEEVLGIYKRGATRALFQVRTCDDASCDTEQFIGPDGSPTSYFSELSNTAGGPPSFNPPVTDARVFQYSLNMTTLDPFYSPEVGDVSVRYGIGGVPGELTQEACTDLSSALVSDYVTELPADPQDGAAENTYYAIRRTSTGRIEVKACSGEQEVISVSR